MLTHTELLDFFAESAETYRFLSQVFFKELNLEAIEELAVADYPSDTGNAHLDEGYRLVRRYFSFSATDRRTQLACEYARVFLAAGVFTKERQTAVPYESVFTSEEGLLFQDSYHEVYRLYRQNSVRKSPGYDFPDDHLSYLCEFQALLARRAVRSLEANDAECALEQVRLSQHVLHDHILSWFDDFEELALHLVKTRFYRGVLKMSKGFFLFDAEVLADMAEELERL